jgi:hypothetical protein
MAQKWHCIFAHCTVARLFRTFTEIQNNSATLQTPCKTTFQTPFIAKDNSRSVQIFLLLVHSKKIQIITWSLLYILYCNCRKKFRRLFFHFLLNFAILRAKIFFVGHGHFFVTSFEFFGRKFGHPARVIRDCRWPPSNFIIFVNYCRYRK